METKYVIVCCDGTSYEMDHQQSWFVWGVPKPERFDLGKLLATGWKPVRETAMGGGSNYTFALVALTR